MRYSISMAGARCKLIMLMAGLSAVGGNMADGMVRTVVAEPPPNPPIRLHFPNCVPDAVSLYA